MEVTIYYFAVDLGTIHGTPLVPIRLDVPPSMEVGTLKYIACYASGMIEEMIALMIPKKPTAEEAGYFDYRWRFSTDTDYDMGDVSILVDLFIKRRVSESLAVEELETQHLGMSIDTNWLRKCPVCGEQNNLSNPKRVTGFDNIPDFSVDYMCSNPDCNEQKMGSREDNRIYDRDKRFYIRIGRWRSEHDTVSTMPLITSFYNGAQHASINGIRADPRRLSESEYCRCGATTPTELPYCWNCGKKNKNVQSKPPRKLPYDLDELRRKVRLEGEMKQSETIARSKAFHERLVKEGVIVKAHQVVVKTTYCKHCGIRNKADAILCRSCGRRLSPSQTSKKT